MCLPMIRQSDRLALEVPWFSVERSGRIVGNPEIGICLVLSSE
jgi:hypothetical protein